MTEVTVKVRRCGVNCYLLAGSTATWLLVLFYRHTIPARFRSTWELSFGVRYLDPKIGKTTFRSDYIGSTIPRTIMRRSVIYGKESCIRDCTMGKRNKTRGTILSVSGQERDAVRVPIFVRLVKTSIENPLFVDQKKKKKERERWYVFYFCTFARRWSLSVIYCLDVTALGTTYCYRWSII